MQNIRKRTEARLKRERERERAFHGSMDGTHLTGDLCLVLSADPKPQLRWTTEFHDLLVIDGAPVEGTNGGSGSWRSRLSGRILILPSSSFLNWTELKCQLSKSGWESGLEE